MPFTKSSIASIAAVIASASAFTGRATWFDVGVGACGVVNTNDQFVVALNPVEYNNGASCFMEITISANGVTASAQVVDLCPSCGDSAVDMSPSLFEQFASLDQGVVEVNWNFD